VYATIRNYSGNAGLADALVENEDEVNGIITGIDGFRAYYLIKTADGCASVSVFDDEAGATESTRAAGEWVRENLPEHAGTAPEVTSGEVVIDF
jgi:heme-degrading monooxygenase HmoA